MSHAINDSVCLFGCLILSCETFLLAPGVYFLRDLHKLMVVSLLSAISIAAYLSQYKKNTTTKYAKFLDLEQNSPPNNMDNMKLSDNDNS